MKTLLTLAFIFLLAANTSAQSRRGINAYGKPLVTLGEYYSDIMPLGVNAYTIVIYETGQIIYRDTVNQKTRYSQAVLTKSEVYSLIRSIGITDSVFYLPNHFETSTSFHDPINQLKFYGDSVKTVGIYGNLRTNSEEARTKVPATVLAIYDNLRLWKAKRGQSEEWLPEQFIVTFSPFDYAKGKTSTWPSVWPTPTTPLYLDQSAQGYLEVFLNKSELDNFIKYNSKRKKTKAILINEKNILFLIINFHFLIYLWTNTTLSQTTHTSACAARPARARTRPAGPAGRRGSAAATGAAQR